MSHHTATMRAMTDRAVRLERAREPVLRQRRGAAPESDYRDDLARHLTQTRRHATMLRAHLERLTDSSGGGPGDLVGDLVQGAASMAVGLVAKTYGLVLRPLENLLDRNGEESVLEGAQAEARTGAELIAAYLALERIAANVGDTELSHLAREIRKEEEWMLQRLGDHIPELAGRAVPPEVTETAEQVGA